MFFILNYEKTTIHIYINQYVGNRFVDAFFFYITYLGDGTMAVFILLVILLVNIRLGLCTAFSFLSASLVSNSLKYFFFDDVNRPSFTFNYIEKYPINYVEGLDIHLHNSFPSGHATQAFAILMCLVFASKNHYLKILFFTIALLTALSRVYLSQHWLIDITAGSIIGTSFSLLCEYFIIHKNKFEKLNKSVFAFKSS